MVMLKVSSIKMSLNEAEVLGALTSPVVVCLQRLTVVASSWSLLKHQFLGEALLVYDP